ncbi:hypothetical protein ElyMa_004586900 [Elysia marginata]|uniref:Uncharacterized protein n=1 Tax=Elysia marginata TaxID=1093978 RepID=A0AAV4HUL3_9GAST|nr:hypothetical protein ElyMa_004586900 [Elysia marginata]
MVVTVMIVVMLMIMVMVVERMVIVTMMMKKAHNYSQREKAIRGCQRLTERHRTSVIRPSQIDKMIKDTTANVNSHETHPEEGVEYNHYGLKENAATTAGLFPSIMHSAKIMCRGFINTYINRIQKEQEEKKKLEKEKDKKREGK